MGEKVVTMETSESSEDELGRLDIDLDRKSRQHNLSSSNVRAILHVSITHKTQQHTHTHKHTAEQMDATIKGHCQC